VFGGAYTEEHLDTKDPKTGRQTILWEPREEHREAIFTQLDWQATRKFKLVLAGRVDASTLHETQFSPKAAVVYSFTPKHSVRLTYNQAFQVANYSEFFLHTRISSFPIGGFVRTICEAPILEEPVDCGIDEDFIPILAVGNDDLDLEHTTAWEIGYSGLIANKVFMTVDYYRAENEGFITDLVQQVGTVLGDLDGCVDKNGNQETDAKQCPINNDYKEWVSTEEAETTILVPSPPAPEPLTVAQALRNAVDNSVGGNALGFRLAQDLDGSTVVVGRTYANVGQVDTQGIDFGIQYFVTPKVNVQASYSWFDFEIIDAEVVDPPECKLPPEIRPRGCLEDILLPNTPEHKGSLSVSYGGKRWFASLSGRWVEGFRWSAGVFTGDVSCNGACNDPPDENARDYTTVDLTGSYGITDHIRVGLNVANLLDNRHHQTFGGDILSRRALLNLAFLW
jgi:outer membrane receptor protein involved in Fe transport